MDRLSLGIDSLNILLAQATASLKNTLRSVDNVDRNFTMNGTIMLGLEKTSAGSER
jgi:hypothetical protein